MRFLTALLLATPSLAGVLKEPILVDDAAFSLDSETDALKSVSFTIHSGVDTIACSATNPKYGGQLTDCAGVDPNTGKGYRFNVFKDASDYSRFVISLYHQTGVAVGGEGNITVGCNGPLPAVCDQLGIATTVLCSDLNACGEEAQGHTFLL